MFVEADDGTARPAWTRLLAHLTPGDQVMISRPLVLAVTGRSLDGRCEEVRVRGASITPLRAGIPERIAMRGGTSRWAARQTGR